MAKRESKISCFITDDARKALDKACVEYDSPQGKLINRMILNFCKLQDIKPKANRFAPPTIDEVFSYCNERCNDVDAQTFVDHYQANGWMRGKVKIKDWKACVRTWEKGSKQGAKQFSDVTNQNITNVGEWLDE